MQLLGALRRLLALLGRFLDASWARLRLSWVSLGRSVAPLGCILASRDGRSLDFERFWDLPGWVVEYSRGMFCILSSKLRISLHNDFVDAVTTLLYLLELFLWAPVWSS